MIKYKTGNILNETTEAVINTVNCVGIMGRGIALQFKKMYPDNFKEYAKACKKGEVVPGKMFIYKNNALFNPKYIINFPTKRHWKGKSNIKDIENGLAALKNDIENLALKSIAIPPLGCGLGGLEWNDVKYLIIEKLGGLEDVEIIIYEPNNEKFSLVSKSSQPPALTAGRAALIELVGLYSAASLDPFISLLEIHKLMYFMQVAGEPLKLKFVKAIYGPYAENLRHVLEIIEGYYINGYNGEDNPYCPITLVPGALTDAEEFLKSNTETLNKFQRVSELVEGFESSFGLELLATVHWIVQQEQIHDIQQIIEAVYSWNIKKRKFTEKQIELAYNTLKSKKWLTNV